MEEIQEKLSIEETLEKDQSKVKLWLKRMGFAGFMFFFLKGLVWLAVFFGLFKACN